ALDEVEQVNEMIRVLVEERGRLERELPSLAIVQKVYPSDANFLLVKVRDAKKTYQYLLDKGIVVRDRSSVVLCADCLRITVGTEKENSELIEALKQYQ
ncbi:MAG: aminotransferase class I/II-fold pyridoxal phosphate-dependent enzyme, partial [Flavihumibacter sp.]|nr:aminotransferase class I/II-fold pyridoxal phosphate-dependent enzyme [Flavihumibacter sp.]